MKKKTIQTDIIQNPMQESSNKQTLRPVSLNEYIGQDFIKKNLHTAIQAAKIKNESLNHILFYGPPGLGKTTLAGVIANEMEARIKIINGTNIEKTGEMAAILANLEERDILFIDEIHRLPKCVEEMLYSAMEDYRIDILIGEANQSKVVSMDLSHFTLIGATTKLGMISQPLRDRFQMVFNMEYYTTEQLEKIVLRTASIYQCNLSQKAVKKIAEYSRKTPRIANHITSRIADYILVNPKEIIEDNISKILQSIGYFENGLQKAEYKYLTLLHDAQGKPMGIKTIASCLGETIDTIQDSMETYLIQEGLIHIYPRGRIITEKGEKIYEAIQCSEKNIQYSG